jgi:hypothetical protein
VSPYDEDPRLRENFQSTLEQVAYGELSAADAAADMIAEWNRILGKL